MKALRYFFCIVLPPLAVLLTGRIASFFLSLILTLLGWIPGIIHACLVVNDYHAEQCARTRCNRDDICGYSVPGLKLRSGLPRRDQWPRRIARRVRLA